MHDAIVAAALDCIVTIDAEGRVIEFNPAAERTFGYAREEVVGRTMSELIIPPRLREAHERGMARLLGTGEMRILNRHVEVDGDPSRRQRISDRADRHAARRRAAAVQPVISATSASASAPRPTSCGWRRSCAPPTTRLSAWIAERRIQHWNDGAERLYGYTRAEAIGHSIELIAAPERHDSVRRVLERVHAGESVERLETERITKDGRRISRSPSRSLRSSTATGSCSGCPRSPVT